MSGDPRWSVVEDFLVWFEANRLEPDPEEFLGRMQDYRVALEGIAGDSALPAEERKDAQEILDSMSPHARTYTGDAIAVLAEIASDETADVAVREDARRNLREVTEQMRGQGTDISHWVTSRAGRPQ